MSSQIYKPGYGKKAAPKDTLTPFPRLEWLSNSPEPDIKSGIATFRWDDSGEERSLVLPLESFEHAHAIGNMIHHTWTAGRRDAEHRLGVRLDTMAKELL